MKLKLIFSPFDRLNGAEPETFVCVWVFLKTFDTFLYFFTEQPRYLSLFHIS